MRKIIVNLEEFCGMAVIIDSKYQNDTMKKTCIEHGFIYPKMQSLEYPYYVAFKHTKLGIFAYLLTDDDILCDGNNERIGKIVTLKRFTSMLGEEENKEKDSCEIN